MPGKKGLIDLVEEEDNQVKARGFTINCKLKKKTIITRKVSSSKVKPSEDSNDPIASDVEENQDLLAVVSNNNNFTYPVGKLLTNDYSLEENSSLTEEFSITVVDEKKEDEKTLRKRNKDAPVKRYSELPLEKKWNEDFLKVAEAFTFLQDFGYEELSEMYKNKDPRWMKHRNAIKSIPKDKVIAILSLDPGAVSASVALFSVSENELWDADDRPFRGQKPASDLGHKGTTDHAFEYAMMFKHKAIVLVIEEQTRAILEHHKKVWEDNCHLEAWAVQYGLQTLFHDRAILFPPNSVKNHFGMPIVEKKTGEFVKASQYETNKKNAVIYGAKLVSPKVREKILLKWKTSQHNAYDAILLGYCLLQKYNGQGKLGKREEEKK